MEHRKPSKVIKKDRYGNSITMEYAPDSKPLDPTALAKHAMDQDMEVPEITMIEQAPPMDHPGGPKGSDTVPAWLTPGEFVVNAEAMRMPGAKQAVESLNNQGRAMQQMQGGSIPSGYMLGGNVEGNTGPHYNTGGQIPFVAGPRLNEPQYQDDGGWITDSLLDKLAEVESGWDNDAVSPVGAIGTYQWLPKSAAQAGYGVKAFDPKDPKAARAATAKYLKNMQKHHGFTPEETLRAYNWGPGNVLNYNRGKRKDIPAEALNYPRKILGVDNPLFQGVTPNETNSVPVPTARPSREVAVPTPKPASVNADASWWDKTKEALGFEGGGHVRNPFPPGTYAHQQFEANRPGQVEYTPPPVNPTISPDVGSTSTSPGYGVPDILVDLLTAGALGFDGGGSVPGFEGQDPSKMSPIRKAAYEKALAAQQNNGVPVATQETINRNNPEVPVVPGLPSGDINTIDTEGDDVPWYNNLLGPKLKAESTLTDKDKEFLDKKTAESEVTSGQLAEEENAIASDDAAMVENAEDAIIKNTLEGPKVPVAVDEFSVDAHKSDIIKKNSTEISKINAEGKGEVQTGPDKNQPGENKSEAEVEAKGSEAPKGFIEEAKGALMGAFGDLFDKKELGRMAIMYAGSRLLGYSHGGSLQFAGKQYVSRIDAKNAAHDKVVAKLTTDGKYTPASIAAYKKSKDLSDLMAVGSTYTPTGNSKVKMIGGKKVPIQEVKGSNGGIYYQLPGGKTVPAASIATIKDYEPSFEKGTPEYRTRRSRATKSAAARFEEVFKRDDRYRVGDNEWKQNTSIGPNQAADEFWAWAESVGLDPESDEALGIMGNAYQQAIADGKGGKFSPRTLTPYLEQQHIRESTGAPELFLTNATENAEGKPPKYVRADKMAKLDQNIDFIISKNPNATKESAYNIAISEWNKLGAEGQKLYNGSAEKGETGFYYFFNAKLAELAQKL